MLKKEKNIEVGVGKNGGFRDDEVQVMVGRRSTTEKDVGVRRGGTCSRKKEVKRFQGDCCLTPDDVCKSLSNLIIYN